MINLLVCLSHCCQWQANSDHHFAQLYAGAIRPNTKASPAAAAAVSCSHDSEENGAGQDNDTDVVSELAAALKDSVESTYVTEGMR